ncbi:hypothetical protein EIP91_001976 [Steccherinum ochraceum]|uniref:Uncharacterized protein n=1 Tax=Steccherinum ochraceum TaxID=92696 RepID=A0A4R0RFE8_9APHY|nr:hypothetical protein EIP91_001976 [Steccherinum ochraceum]
MLTDVRLLLFNFILSNLLPCLRPFDLRFLTMAPPKWTTDVQFIWLSSLVPHFRRAQEDAQVQNFYASTTEAFLNKWPDGNPTPEDYKAASQDPEAAIVAQFERWKRRIVNWYGYNTRPVKQGKPEQKNTTKSLQESQHLQPHQAQKLALTNKVAQKPWKLSGGKGKTKVGDSIRVDDDDLNIEIERLCKTRPICVNDAHQLSVSRKLKPKPAYFGVESRVYSADVRRDGSVLAAQRKQDGPVKTGRSAATTLRIKFEHVSPDNHNKPATWASSTAKDLREEMSPSKAAHPPHETTLARPFLRFHAERKAKAGFEHEEEDTERARGTEVAQNGTEKSSTLQSQHTRIDGENVSVQLLGRNLLHLAVNGGPCDQEDQPVERLKEPELCGPILALTEQYYFRRSVDRDDVDSMLMSQSFKPQQQPVPAPVAKGFSTPPTEGTVEESTPSLLKTTSQVTTGVYNKMLPSTKNINVRIRPQLALVTGQKESVKGKSLSSEDGSDEGQSMYESNMVRPELHEDVGLSQTASPSPLEDPRTATRAPSLSVSRKTIQLLPEVVAVSSAVQFERSTVPLHLHLITLNEASPDWMKESVAHFCSTYQQPAFLSLVAVWIDYEAVLGYPDGRDRTNHFPIDGRPDQVATWMRTCKLDRNPIARARCNLFIAEFKDWWRSMQPNWRELDDGEWPLSHDVECKGQNWGPLRRGGNRAIYLVIMCVSWWLEHALDSNRDDLLEDALEAVDEVCWVLRHMTLPDLSSTTPGALMKKRAAPGIRASSRNRRPRHEERSHV